MAWMPLLIRNLSNEIENFKYHGIDVVESVIDSLKIKFRNEENWKFSLNDITKQRLPSNYDLIISRDALQHLPLDLCVDTLKAFASATGSRYLLIGSYLDSKTPNKNIDIGDYFPINLKLPPFSLIQYIEVFHEEKDKYLILYDVENYLSKIDFDLMKKNL